MIGFATGIGVGMNALLSKSLGEGNQQRANKAAGNGIFAALIAVALFMIFGFVGAEGYYAVQSDVAETVAGGAAYIGICSVWCLGIFLEIIGERLLQGAHGGVNQMAGELIELRAGEGLHEVLRSGSGSCDVGEVDFSGGRA